MAWPCPGLVLLSDPSPGQGMGCGAIGGQNAGSQKYEKQKKPSGHLMLHRATVPGGRKEPRRTARRTARERKTSWGPLRLTSLLHFPFLLPPNCCLLIAWGLRVGRDETQVGWRGTLPRPPVSASQ